MRPVSQEQRHAERHGLWRDAQMTLVIGV